MGVIIMTNEELIKHLRQLGKYSEFKPNYLLLAADRIEELSGRVEVVRKSVKGYEGYYEVDQFGRVYGVDRMILVNDNGRQYNKLLKAKQMKQSIHTKGYKTVSLTKDGKTKTCYVHRIVAEAFVDNPDNLSFINHKDEDKTNNFVDNLEWCTNEYNINYGTATKRRARALKGKKHTKEHNSKISISMKNYRDNERAEKGYCDNGKRKPTNFCSYGERKESEVTE